MADSPPETTVDIAIVGGGISGLYCALQLARRLEAKQSLLVGGAELPRRRDTPRIHVYETRDSFGGRIETWTVDVAPYRPVVTTVDCPYDEDVTPDRIRPDAHRAARPAASQQPARRSRDLGTDDERAE
jgi:hypothetical protein